MQFYNSLKSKYGGIVNPALEEFAKKQQKSKLEIANTASVLPANAVHPYRKRYARTFIERHVPDLDRYSIWYRQKVLFHKSLSIINRMAPSQSTSQKNNFVELDLSKKQPIQSQHQQQGQQETKINSKKKDKNKSLNLLKFKRYYNTSKLSRSGSRGSNKIDSSNNETEIADDSTKSEIILKHFITYDNFVIKCALYDHIVTWPLFKLIKWRKGIEDIPEVKEFLVNAEKAMTMFFAAINSQDVELLDKMIGEGEFKDEFYNEYKNFFQVQPHAENQVLFATCLVNTEFNDSLVYSWFDSDECDAVTAHKFYADNKLSVVSTDLDVPIKSDFEKPKMYFCVVQWTKDIMGNWRIKSIGYEFTN